MICMSHGLPVMKDLKMNDQVAVELPAFIWYGFVRWYQSDPNLDPDLQRVVNGAAEAVFDPLWLRESQAEHEAEMEKARQQRAVMIPGAVLGFQGGTPGPDPTDPRFQSPEDPE